jgi:hypothetical protein
MVECQLKGLFCNCNEKYFSGHKYKEQNISMAISKDVDVPLLKRYYNKIILLHYLIHHKLNR